MSSRTSPIPARAPSPPSTPGPTVLVWTSDALLARHLLSVVAAAGVRAEQPSAEEDLRRSWRGASACLVGLDRAPRLAELGLPTRPAVHVVGRDGDRLEADRWATRLWAAAATLPVGAPDLTGALSATLGGDPSGGLVGVIGGSGGVGASTLAAGLALAGAREGLRAFLLDTDPGGGGLDVLLGAEHLAGWRWSSFEAARGHLGDLGGQLPQVDGVDVLAVDRAAVLGAWLHGDQVAAVLGSAARTHDLTVADLPRALAPVHEEVVRRAGCVLVVVRADVRGVAAADATVQTLGPRCRELEVVVRTGRRRSLEPEEVADALDLRLAGVLEHDPALLAAADRGDPPGQPGRSALARLCTRLLARRLVVAA